MNESLKSDQEEEEEGHCQLQEQPLLRPRGGIGPFQSIRIDWTSGGPGCHLLEDLLSWNSRVLRSHGEGMSSKGFQKMALRKLGQRSR